MLLVNEFLNYYMKIITMTPQEKEMSYMMMYMMMMMVYKISYAFCTTNLKSHFDVKWVHMEIPLSLFLMPFLHFSVFAFSASYTCFSKLSLSINENILGHWELLSTMKILYHTHIRFWLVLHSFDDLKSILHCCDL